MFVADAVAMRPTVVPIVTIVVVGTVRTRILVFVGTAEFGFEECHLFLQLFKTRDDIIGNIRQIWIGRW